jgi:hypothetical protein
MLRGPVWRNASHAVRERIRAARAYFLARTMGEEPSGNTRPQGVTKRRLGERFPLASAAVVVPEGSCSVSAGSFDSLDIPGVVMRVVSVVADNVTQGLGSSHRM